MVLTKPAIGRDQTSVLDDLDLEESITNVILRERWHYGLKVAFSPYGKSKLHLIERYRLSWLVSVSRPGTPGTDSFLSSSKPKRIGCLKDHFYSEKEELSY